MSRKGKLTDWHGEVAKGTRGGQLQAMADLVAMAIHRSVVSAEDSEGWNDLTEGERNDFRLAAHAAMGAHDAWLTLNGWVVVRVEETKGREILVIPTKPALVGPDGRPIN